MITECRVIPDHELLTGIPQERVDDVSREMLAVMVAYPHGITFYDLCDKLPLRLFKNVSLLCVLIHLVKTGRVNARHPGSREQICTYYQPTVAEWIIAAAKKEGVA